MRHISHAACLSSWCMLHISYRSSHVVHHMHISHFLLVCRMSHVASRIRHVACCMSYVACCMPRFTCFLLYFALRVSDVACRMLHAALCTSHVAWCTVHFARRTLCVVCCVSHVACRLCMLHVACCMSHVRFSMLHVACRILQAKFTDTDGQIIADYEARVNICRCSLRYVRASEGSFSVHHRISDGDRKKMAYQGAPHDPEMVQSR